MKNVRRPIIVVLSVALLGFNSSLRSAWSQNNPTQLDGFTAEGSATERQWESEFRAIPEAASAREHLRRLTAQPHVAGTKEDYDTAIYVRDQIRSYGIPSELKEYDVLLPYPKQPTILELVAPRRERLGQPTYSVEGFLGLSVRECHRLGL